MKGTKAHLVKMPVSTKEPEEPPEVPPKPVPIIPMDLPSRVDFSYSKRLFFQRFYLQILLIALVVLLVSPLFLDVPLIWAAVILTIFVVYFVLYSLSPLLTTHTLTPDNLILRQGLYFRSTIPLGEIDSVEEIEEYAKVGVKFALTHKKLYVTASRYGLVQIRIKEPKRFPLALGKEADTIVIDVENRLRFVELANLFLLRYETPTPASPDQSS